MKKNTNNKKSGSVGKTIAIGVGAAAVGAGAYYLLGPKSKAHQKKAKALIAKMQKEVKIKVAEAKVVTEPLYHKAVDFLSANYAKQYKEHGPAIKAFANKLKKEWKSSKKEIIKKVSKTPKKKRVIVK